MALRNSSPGMKISEARLTRVLANSKVSRAFIRTKNKTDGIRQVSGLKTLGAAATANGDGESQRQPTKVLSHFRTATIRMSLVAVVLSSH
jgi:hypothetical protein